MDVWNKFLFSGYNRRNGIIFHCLKLKSYFKLSMVSFPHEFLKDVKL